MPVPFVHQGAGKEALWQLKCLAEEHNTMYRARSSFLEAPGNYRARKAVLFSIPDGSFKSFEYYTVKLLAKETKWTLLEFGTHATFLEILAAFRLGTRARCPRTILDGH